MSDVKVISSTVAVIFAITWVVNNYNIPNEPRFYEPNRTKLIPNFSKHEPKLTCRPWEANLWREFEIMTVLGAVFPHFCPDKRKIWHGEADCRGADNRLHRAKFHFYRANMSPLQGKKTIFGPLSKNNTGMAAQTAGKNLLCTSLAHSSNCYCYCCRSYNYNYQHHRPLPLQC